MGSCFSSFPDNRIIQCESQTSILYSTSAATTAKVVTVKGDLVEYKVPVFVSQVLEAEAPSSFLCNSDCLLFDDYIPAMDLDEELQANQIYFVLPTFKLQDKLSASDMAALAVKASVALQKNDSKKGSNRRKRQAKARISPVLSLNDQSVSIARSKPKTSFDHKHKLPVSGYVSGDTIGISRSASVKRLRTYTSRRAKLAARSFRLRLGTIYEGIVM